MAKYFEPTSRRLIVLPDPPVYVQRGYAGLKTRLEQLEARVGTGTAPDISFGTAAPTNGVDTPSHQYYQTSTSTLYIYAGGVWYPITGGGPVVDTLRITSGGDTRVDSFGNSRKVS